MKTLTRLNAIGAAVIVLALAAAGCTTAGTPGDASAAGSGGSGIVAAAETAADSSSSAATSSAQVEPSDTVAAALEDNQESHATADELTYDEAVVVEISLDGATASSADDRVVIDGSTVTITTAGVYALSGALDNGQVLVDAADSDDVTLILNGVDIVNSDGPAISAESADEVTVILGEGTTNSLADGSADATPETETDAPSAALASASDFTIAGTGILLVTGKANDGISSKDGLVIEGGTIKVDAVDDGIRGKDYVIINGGDIEIIAVGDGIKADNDEDVDRGYVLITDGTVDLTSGDDGIQAATDALITGGTITVNAGSDASSEDSGRAIQGDVMVVVSGGVITADAGDDALHSNSAVTIDGGDLTLASGDDGIHSDFAVTINGGSVVITESFEGIESEVITINAGFIDVTATDDGLNVADGTAAETNTLSVGPGRGGGGEVAGEYYIYINGGTTMITIGSSSAADGDGIDSNGSVVMTGGVVVINGPTDTRNSALDYNGTFEVSGGLIIGTNINGMNSEGVGAGSTQASMYLTSAGALDAGTVVHIEDTDGTSLVTFEPANPFDVIVFTSEDLVDGGTYDVYFGGTVTGTSDTGLYDDADYEHGELAGTVTASL